MSFNNYEKNVILENNYWLLHYKEGITAHFKDKSKEI